MGEHRARDDIDALIDAAALFLRKRVPALGDWPLDRIADELRELLLDKIEGKRIKRATK